MNHLSRSAVQSETIGICLIYALHDLIDATASLDAKPRNRHRVVQELVEVAYRVAAAAQPVLADEAALITALRDAAAARPSLPRSCAGCQKMDGGRCGAHAGSTAVAETFHELGHALCGPTYAAFAAAQST